MANIVFRTKKYNLYISGYVYRADVSGQLHSAIPVSYRIVDSLRGRRSKKLSQLFDMYMDRELEEDLFMQALLHE